VNGLQKKQRDPKQITFHPQVIDEYDIPGNMGLQLGHLGVRPEYRQYLCGACGSQTTGRVLCDIQRRGG
jgi:hypothetical protein